MTAIADGLDVSNAVSKCQNQIEQMRRAGSELNPMMDGDVFGKQVVDLQASVLQAYQLTARESIRKADPKEAAMLWREMADLCDAVLGVLKELKSTYPLCGTPELYDLMLAYRGEAQERYYQNLQDSECQTTSAGLFP